MTYDIADIPTNYLILSIIGLVLVLAILSGIETGVLTLNRYKLKHLEKLDSRAAIVANLLKRPDRLLGLLLIGNTFLNVCASVLATILGLRLLGESGAIISAIILTFILLVFSEVTPKTLATMKPEMFAFTFARMTQYLLYLSAPIIFFVTSISNLLIMLFGHNYKKRRVDDLTVDELRTLLNETSSFIPLKQREMLASLLDLGKATVNDVMIPRTEIVGINLDDSLEEIKTQLLDIKHSLVPVFTQDINNLKGLLFLGDLVKLTADFNNISKNKIKSLLYEPYFVPEGTLLNIQLYNFQRNKKSLAFVVDEYGEILGLLTLKNILEEIVGELIQETSSNEPQIIKLKDGLLIDGGMNIRNINKALNWNIPYGRAKTLSGIITEYLEAIPQENTCLKLHGHYIEIIKVEDNMVKQVKFYLHNTLFK